MLADSCAMKRFLVLLLGFVVALLPACEAQPPPLTTTTTLPDGAPALDPIAAATPPVPIMGKSVYNAKQLTKWYASKKLTQPVGSCTNVADLAQIYITEGARENIRGDMAFVQAMLETGWLQHSARVPAYYCNYAGIGAVDGGTDAVQFESAVIGVRAQIQQLRAYADKRTTCKNFATPTVTPRCELVKPKGKVKYWNEMGGGNWATDPFYSIKILNLFADLQRLIPK